MINLPAENSKKSEQNNASQANIHKYLNQRKSSGKEKFKSPFLIWNFTLSKLSNDSTHNSTLRNAISIVQNNLDEYEKSFNFNESHFVTKLSEQFLRIFGLFVWIKSILFRLYLEFSLS